MTATVQPARSVQVPIPQFDELLLRADQAQIVASLTLGLAHDLRGPLQTLTLFVDPHADLLGGAEGSRLRLAASGSVQQLAETIGRFSQIYAPAEAEPAPVLLDDLLASVVDLQRFQRGLSPMETQLELAGGLPPVRGIEPLLRHLLLALVSNARQALLGREDPGLLLTASSEGTMVRIAVEDRGPGMSDREREQAFQPFYTTWPGHLGIGLTVAQGLARRHAGTLTLEAGTAGGTRAVLRLPAWRRGA